MSWVSLSASVGLSRAQRVLPDQPQAPSISSVEQMPPVACRVESDLLGDRDVPAEAYCGIHTLRARENFRITGIAILTYPDFVNALAAVKQTAATANRELGLLPGDKAAAKSTCIGAPMHTATSAFPPRCCKAVSMPRFSTTRTVPRPGATIMRRW